MTPNERAFITIAKELRQLELAVSYGEMAILIRDKTLSADNNRYADRKTSVVAGMLDQSTNAHERVASFVPFVQGLAQHFEGLPEWLEEAKLKILRHRQAVDAFCRGEDVVMFKVAESRD